ncbi:hypothetical protein [Bacillus toyonensis]|uniref:hypothetical protein n=1 Tax=Bacillus toyonensis TaxID=155322 RepID=UPI001146096A|nr:hypothetical protein [Bacillus toyonensis]
MTCYESIVLFMNKWIGILARCANTLLHHDDNVLLHHDDNVPKMWCVYFRGGVFLFSKRGKDHE